MYDFTDLVKVVYDEITAHVAFRRISPAKLWTFCVDITLIASSARCTYLFDAFFVANAPDLFHRLIHSLRTKNSFFEFVVHWYDEALQQSFFLNVRLLEEIQASLNSSLNDGPSFWTTFVHLRGIPLLCDIPSSVVEAIIDMTYRSTSTPMPSPSLKFPPGLTSDVFVPLAAVLLEYPVAYVPTSAEQTSFLAGADLDVYEVVADIALHDKDLSSRPHSCLKFSCPAQISEESPGLSAAHLMEKLRSRFEPRFINLGLNVDILHQAQKFDRVAL